MSIKRNFVYNVLLNLSRVIFPLITTPYISRVLEPMVSGCSILPIHTPDILRCSLFWGYRPTAFGKIVSVLRELEIEQIELLLCYDLGAKKYEKLGLTHTDCSADKKLMEEFSESLNAEKITVSKLTI